MRRSLLVLLLLLNYLLVVCASVAERPAHPVARAFDYVHSADCQLKNAWRGGACFDDCNGVQYHVHKGHAPVPLQQLLTTLKGLDLHCLPVLAGVAPALAGYPAAQPLAGLTVRVPAGVRVPIYSPPRRG